MEATDYRYAATEYSRLDHYEDPEDRELTLCGRRVWVNANTRMARRLCTHCWRRANGIKTRRNRKGSGNGKG